MPFFNSFQLDVPNASLRRGTQAIFLAPKAFRVLQYLVEHPGQLVSKDDLFGAVWPGIAVTDATLAVCLSQIRKALGDEPKRPRYIETVHRLGYRFIAPVSGQTGAGVRSDVKRRVIRSAPPLQSASPTVVGRETELAELHKNLEEALRSKRQILFVTGEPGIGKTTLVETFLQQVAAESSPWIGRGQCIEQYGAGEAYLPVLDALGRLCRMPGGDHLIHVLDQHAPTWLLQMSALLNTTEMEKIRRRIGDTPRVRMLRELAEALETITAERPMILWLEDLHWSDHSTIEWLSFLARRQEPAALLVLGTYRPVDVIVREHPLKVLKDDLLVHAQCRELPLALLSEAAVTEYLNLRFSSPVSSDRSRGQCGGVAPVAKPLRELAHRIYQRTDGNPLFIVNVVDNLVGREVSKTGGDTVAPQSLQALVEGGSDMPPSVVQMIERNLERLNRNEQAMLEAASVAGAEFAVAAVAAALEQPITEVERSCSRLSRQQLFVQSRGTVEWPDGTVTARFRFLHGLYCDVLYDRVPPARRLELHRRIAEREEPAFGQNVSQIAMELVHHYGLSGDKTKALKYLQVAGERAAAQHAYHEAEQHYREAIAVLLTLPESAERDHREMVLQSSLGSVMAAVGRFAETTEAYSHARSLAERIGGDSLQILYGLSMASLARGEIRAAVAIGNEMLNTARRITSPRALFLAHAAHGDACHFCGDLVAARADFVEARQYFREADFREADFRGVPDHAAIDSLDFQAATEWHLGYPDRCLQYAEEEFVRARQRNDRPSDFFAYWAAAFAHRLRGDWPRMLETSEQTLRMSALWKSPVATPTAKVYIAYARAKMGKAEGAADQIRQGLDELVASKFYVARGRHSAGLPKFSLLRVTSRQP